MQEARFRPNRFAHTLAYCVADMCALIDMDLLQDITNAILLAIWDNQDEDAENHYSKIIVSILAVTLIAMSFRMGMRLAEKDFDQIIDHGPGGPAHLQLQPQQNHLTIPVRIEEKDTLGLFYRLTKTVSGGVGFLHVLKYILCALYVPEKLSPWLSGGSLLTFLGLPLKRRWVSIASTANHPIYQDVPWVLSDLDFPLPHTIDNDNFYLAQLIYLLHPFSILFPQLRFTAPVIAGFIQGIAGVVVDVAGAEFLTPVISLLLMGIGHTATRHDTYRPIQRYFKLKNRPFDAWAGVGSFGLGCMFFPWLRDFFLKWELPREVAYSLAGFLTVFGIMGEYIKHYSFEAVADMQRGLIRLSPDPADPDHGHFNDPSHRYHRLPEEEERIENSLPARPSSPLPSSSLSAFPSLTILPSLPASVEEIKHESRMGESKKSLLILPQRFVQSSKEGNNSKIVREEIDALSSQSLFHQPNSSARVKQRQQFIPQTSNRGMRSLTKVKNKSGFY